MKPKLILVFVLFINLVNAQSPLFFQYLTNPLFINPGFAGAFERPEYSLTYNQNLRYNYYASSISEQISNNDKSIGFSYSQYWDKIKGGFGISYTHNEGNNVFDGVIRDDDINLTYSPNIDLVKGFVLKPFVSSDYNLESFPHNNINFNYSDELPSKYFNLNFGTLVYNKNAYFGMTFYRAFKYFNPKPKYYDEYDYYSKLERLLPSAQFYIFNAGMSINDSIAHLLFSPDAIYLGNYYWTLYLGGTIQYNRIFFTFHVNITRITEDHFTFGEYVPIMGFGYKAKSFSISYNHFVLGPVAYLYEGINSIKLTYSLPSKARSTPPVYITMY